MSLRNLLIVLGFFMAFSSYAQIRYRLHRTHPTDTVPVIVKQYTDSLSACRERIDSLSLMRREADEDNLDGIYYRLFVPPTFYHDVVRRAFTIGADTVMGMEDQSMMDLYLRRPDLVASTQSQLEHTGGIINPEPDKMKPDADMVDVIEMAKPDPVYPDMDMPINIYVEKPNFWTVSGDYSLQLFQNFVSSNWYKGGESNYSVLGTVTLQANYNNKQRFRWDNKLEMRLGLQSSRGDTLHAVRASEDLLRYTGKVGLQASKRWYYTFQLIASTQFMHGLKSNDHTIYSAFMSPLTVNPSVGMDYNVNGLKGNLTGSVHLAPIAYNYTYVRKLAMATRYGIEAGRRTKSDFGSEITIDLKWQITKDIRWKTRMYAYTTYKRMLMEWENTFTFVVNKYISSNLFLYPRFDDSAKRDDHHGFWQMKEYISLGFNYGF